MAKVTINILTFNASKYINQCLSAVFAQTYRDFRVIVIDNASNDGTVEFIRKNFPEVMILKNFQNLGFCRASNQGILLTKEQYLLFLNQDAILSPDFLKILVSDLESDQQIGAIGGKILKVSSEKEYLGENLRSDIIDTAGIKVFRSRRMVDRGAGEKDLGQYNQREEVFGLSSAVALYRREALEDIKVILPVHDINEYNDESFFMYKDDVDLSWRLRLRSWKIIYNPSAVAYHYRGAFGSAKATVWQIIRERKSKSKWISRYSYVNHWKVILKNDFFSNFIRDFVYIFFYEMKKIFYLLLFERRTLLGFFSLISEMNLILQKRKFIQKRKLTTSAMTRKWFK